jgi:hypothetical protein
VKPIGFARFGLGFALLAFVAGTVAAQNEDVNKVITFGLSTDYFSKYIWRGQNINNGSVLQPAISVSAYGFTGSVWGNLDTTNRSHTAPDNAWQFSEFDWSLDYTTTVPDVNWLSVSVGVIYYRFPDQPYTINKRTTEIYTGFSLPTVPLTPSFKWYRDVESVKGSYFQFGLSQTFDKIMTLGKYPCSLVLGASYGWGNVAYNKGYFGVDSSGSNDLTLSAGLPITVGRWTIKPSLNYSTMLDNSIRKASYKSDNFWTGVGISTSF